MLELSNDARRLRIVELDKGLLVSILQGACRDLVFHGMPNDAMIVGSNDGFEKNTIQLKIWSKTFSEVLDGSHIPPLFVRCLFEQKE